MGICADIHHLCQSDWKHLCGRDEAPCPACDFVATEKPWAPWFDWYYVEMMKCAQKRKRGCQHEDWWVHFCLPDIDELPGQCYHPLSTIDLAAFHFLLKAPREPVPGKAPGGNPKRDSVPSLEAPREQHPEDQDMWLRPVQQISESLHVTTQKSQSLPGR